MGQCYTVEAKVKFKDKAEFCKAVQEEIKKRQGKTARFDLTRGDLNDPFGCFKILTSADAYELGDDEWIAEFDGSYGWESVMIEIFSEVLNELEDGSFVKIYPDDGCITIA